MQTVVTCASKSGGAICASGNSQMLHINTMTEPASLPESDEPQVSNLTRVNVDFVKAELVRMHQSTAQNIEADEIELHISGAFDVKSSQVSAHETGLGLVTANAVTLQNSGAGAVRAENVSINGYAGAVVAGNVEMGNTYAGLVAGAKVSGQRIESLILLSPKVEGNVTTVLNTRGVIIAGLISGLFAGIMLLLGRMLFGQDKS